MMNDKNYNIIIKTIPLASPGVIIACSHLLPLVDGIFAYDTSAKLQYIFVQLVDVDVNILEAR